MKNFMKTIQIEDPRQQHKSKTYVTGCNWACPDCHPCGCRHTGRYRIFGECHAETLAKYLSFPNGMPSHDTIGRVLQLVDPTYLYELQTNWNQFLYKPMIPL